MSSESLSLEYRRTAGALGGGGIDSSGTQLLAANGHYALTLGSDKYVGTLGKRGTIEFDKPSGAQIGALGIRIPAVAAHTYTTLPALAK